MSTDFSEFIQKLDSLYIEDDDELEEWPPGSWPSCEDTDKDVEDFREKLGVAE